MEILKPETKHEHKWLEWLGLEEPPPDADTWLPVARDFHITDPRTGGSAAADQLVELLGKAGIEAHPRGYQFYTARGVNYDIATNNSVPRVAVLVHNHDLERAREVAAELQRLWDSQTVSDEELTRQALEAGPPPEV